MIAKCAGFFTNHTRCAREGNIFISVCLSVCLSTPVQVLPGGGPIQEGEVVRRGEGKGVP